MAKSAFASAKIHPSREAEIEPTHYSLEKFRLYETRQRFYLIGSDRNKKIFRVLKIDRSEPSDLNISEDPVVYPPHEMKSLLQRIDEGNRATGGLNFVVKVYGIVGCIKFLESFYLILVTKRRQIGCICGHAIYSIEESQLITVPHVSVQSDVAHSKTELRYKKLLSSVDLTKDFFFSYTYPIMHCLQKNVSNDGCGMSYDSIFVWNAFLTKGIRERCNNTIWTIALVHGNFKQVRLSIFSMDFSVSLISRRSRHFAGTRFLKRGVNDRGRVANDVETEQIIIAEGAGRSKGKMSSVVQMRGSIPLFWSQEASRFSPKPDIRLHRCDPTYEATRLHFEDLARRYGNPIIVLNLIKTVEKRPREMMLRREFAHAVGYLNTIFPEESHLKFIHWDFHKFSKSKSANVLAVLEGVATEALNLTSFYYSGNLTAFKRVGNKQMDDARETSVKENLRPSNIARCKDGYEERGDDKHDGNVPRFQSGVLRTNCIDCLDRTNVAQYAYGLAALGYQLHAMGLTDVPKVDPDSSIAAALMEMYLSMGDALAHQYGGSAAHNTVFTERQGKWKATTQSREFLKSIKRYYSNTYTDGEKQDAINLFLGYFQPHEGKPALWELDSDYYLHVSGFGEDLCSDNCYAECAANLLPKGARITFTPVPSCQEDFQRIKLTSLDKLIEKTCGTLKSVRLFREPDLSQAGNNGNLGVAPDAVEIQLRTPTWLFGQKKYDESPNTPKTSEVRIDDADISLDGYRITEGNMEVEDCARVAPFDSDNGWYGGSLLGDQDESSDMYKHYEDCCLGIWSDHFTDDPDSVKHYADALSLDAILADDAGTEAEMEAALNEYNQIGNDHGISSTSLFDEDPSRLTRWILGEERFEKL